MKHKFLIITGLVMSVLVIFHYLQLFDLMAFDLHTSVIPGWHTTIFPLDSLVLQTLILILAILQVGYWIIWLIKKISQGVEQ